MPELNIYLAKEEINAPVERVIYGLIIWTYLSILLSRMELVPYQWPSLSWLKASAHIHFGGCCTVLLNEIKKDVHKRMKWYGGLTTKLDKRTGQHRACYGVTQLFATILTTLPPLR